jgi:hypothetical protein
MIEDQKLVKEAQSIPLDIVKELPQVYQAQFARVRDDFELG